MYSPEDLGATLISTYGWPGAKDLQNKTDEFLLVYGILYIIENFHKIM